MIIIRYDILEKNDEKSIEELGSPPLELHEQDDAVVSRS